MTPSYLVRPPELFINHVYPPESIKFLKWISCKALDVSRTMIREGQVQGSLDNITGKLEMLVAKSDSSRTKLPITQLNH